MNEVSITLIETGIRLTEPKIVLASGTAISRDTLTAVAGQSFVHIEASATILTGLKQRTSGVGDIAEGANDCRV